MDTKNENALAVVTEAHEVMRNTQPLTSSQVLAGLNAIRGVMRDCMVEKQDYGTVSGCGPKPGLFQPGAQKLSMMFQLNPEVREEVITDYPNFHRGYRLVVRVTNGTKFADGVGECSTLESRYRYRSQGRKCPNCGKETIIKGKEEYGGGWVCYVKKGGCGSKFVDNSEGGKEIAAQSEGKTENENPPDCWNTVRKMAFKRAFVHAIINATNTSELWSQDLEDLAANGMTPQGDTANFEEAQPQSAAKETKAPPKASKEQSGASEEVGAKADEPFKGDWRNVRVPFGRNKDKQLGELGDRSLLWYVENADIGKTTAFRKALDLAAQEVEAGTPAEDDNVPF